MPSTPESTTQYVYIAYASEESATAKRIARVLIDAGFTTFLAGDSLQPGDDWDMAIGQAMQRATAFVIVMGSEKPHFYLEQEIAVAVQRSKIEGGPLVIPILSGNADYSNLPYGLSHYQGIDARTQDLDDVGRNVIVALGRHQGRRQALAEKRQEKAAAIQTSAADHIRSSLERLSANETKYSRIAWFWYLLGLVSLTTGASIGVWRLVALQEKNGDWAQVCLTASLAMVAAVLIIAISKYSFGLGKAYMVEALRNSDRMHAISFGEFYLKAFSDTVDRGELKGVLQHWNIDKGSAFMFQESAAFDPQLTGSLVKLLEAVKGLQSGGAASGKE